MKHYPMIFGSRQALLSTAAALIITHLLLKEQTKKLILIQEDCSVSVWSCLLFPKTKEIFFNALMLQKYWSETTLTLLELYRVKNRTLY